VVSPEEGSGLIPKRIVLFRIFVTIEKVLVNAAGIKSNVLHPYKTH